MSRAPIVVALLGAAGLGAYLYLRRTGSVPDLLGIGSDPKGDPYFPILQGEPVDLQKVPWNVVDTPENRAKDAYVLVRGDTKKAAFVLGLGIYPVTPNEVTEIGRLHGLDFPNSTIYAVQTRLAPILDPALIAAVVEQESGGDPNAERFEAGIKDSSLGLMQLLTKTALWVAPFRGETSEQIARKLRDPLINVAVGVKYLYWQYARYSDPNLWGPWPREAWALAAYNAGSVFYNFHRQRFSNQSYVTRTLARVGNYVLTFPTRKGTGG